MKNNVDMYVIAATYQQYVSKSAAILAGICTLSVFLYGIFLLEAVMHTTSRTAAERQIRHLTSELGTLESQYLAQAQSLTPEHARSLGYVQPVSVTTVFATAESRSLTLR